MVWLQERKRCVQVVGGVLEQKIMAEVERRAESMCKGKQFGGAEFERNNDERTWESRTRFRDREMDAQQGEEVRRAVRGEDCRRGVEERSEVVGQMFGTCGGC